MKKCFTISETINTLTAIFEKHRNERICVVSTTCVGKTTILNQIPYCVDMDSVVFNNLTEEEVNFISQKPWTEEIGKKVDEITCRNANIKPGEPMFGTVIVDCEAVVYLDISDEILAAHCKNRGVNLLDAMNMKESIERDWYNHKEKGGKVFYYVTVTE